MDPTPEPAHLMGRFEVLPGWELVRVGLDDLAAGSATIEAALVGLASMRLGSLQLDLPAGAIPSSPEHLYELIVAEVGEERAHSRYNALRRRLASFLRSADRAQTD
ncbi:hypothetical protein BH24CHL9_BH24CHL9_02160 [soil metagenome]